jgi:L-2-hydroxyglutarate oxidase LhgO
MKCLSIGGVAGGATTAARLRRIDEHCEIIIFERGEYISYANCGLPYYIGGTITERDNLFVQMPETFGTRFNLEVRNLSEVTAIDRKKKEVTVKDLRTGGLYLESYDKRIDLFSAAISKGVTVHDLAGIEHAYAPPYSSAKDPENKAIVNETSAFQ